MMNQGITRLVAGAKVLHVPRRLESQATNVLDRAKVRLRGIGELS